MPSLYYFVLLFIFYVCVESEGQRSCFISLVCVQYQVDQRTLGLQNHLEITRALEVICPNPLPSYFINSQPLQKHFQGKECLNARISNFINHDKANWYIIISFKKYVFIYLFGCAGFQFQHRGSLTFLAAFGIFSWGTQDLVLWLRTEPRPPALRAQILRHRTTREVPVISSYCCLVGKSCLTLCDPLD